MITKDSSVLDAVVDLEATIKANEYIFQIKRQHFLELELRDEQIKKLEQKLKERNNAIEELKQQLALTEKALELACEKCLSFPCSDYCSNRDGCEDCFYKKEYTPEKFKIEAKEIIESE